MSFDQDLDKVAIQTQRLRTALLERHGLDDQMSIPVGDDKALTQAARHARVNSHWGITSEIPIVGPLIVMFRRLLRLALRWYINPIVEQQNQFNDSVVQALNQLETDLDRLKQQENKAL